MLIFLLLMITFGVLAYTIEVGFLIGIVVLLVIFMVVNYTFRSGQVWDLSQIDTHREKIELYKKQREELIPEFRKYLAEVYPQIEKDLFASMSPSKESDLRIYMAKYPEIQSNQTINRLVDELSRCSNKIIAQEEEIANINARTKARYLDAKVWTVPGVVKKEYKSWPKN